MASTFREGVTLKPTVKNQDSFGSLKYLNRLPRGDKEQVYQDLIPSAILDDERWRSAGGTEPFIQFVCPAELGLVRIKVRRTPSDRDSIFFMQAADTLYGQLELTLCIISDVDSRRFDIDKDPEGKDNCLGTLTRNVPEEVRAMNAGLCPHQVHSGLGLFREFFSRFDRFAGWLGVENIVAEPLSYNTAILYEQLGFGYLSGYRFMKWIDREFREGGLLAQRLNNSSPFRRPDMNRTVRGRSWAIHDGILQQTWDGIKIYKTVGESAGVNTFPAQKW